MNTGLSKGKKVLSLQEARERFHRTGKSVVEFSKAYGFCASLVYDILNGNRKCLRGQSHEIAVRLGIKDGVIEGTK